MDIITKNRLLLWISILLAIINIITISAFLIFHSDSSNKNPPNKGDDINKVRDFLKKELELTSGQKLILDSLFNDYLAESNKSKEDIHKYHELINKQIIENENFANTQIKFDSLGRMKSQLDKKTYRFFYEIYKICTNDQKVKYKNLFKDISKMLAPGPPTKRR